MIVYSIHGFGRSIILESTYVKFDIVNLRSGRRLAFVLALSVLSLPGFATPTHVEIEPGRIYPGGTPLRTSDLGVAFTTPKGWNGLWPPGGEALILQPESDPQTTILGVGDEDTRAELAATMAAPIDLGDGVFLHPVAPVGERGRALTGRYRVEGSATPLAGYAEALAGPGTSVAFVLIGAPDSLPAYEAAVHALIDSTRFDEPDTASAAEPVAGAAVEGAGSAGGDRWDEYLKGKYIVRYYTDTGYTDEQHLWLCSDGTFQRRGAAGGFGGGASGAFQSDSTGRWSAAGAGERGVLTLHYGDGSTATHELRWDYETSRLYVDGKRWLHGENEVCR